VDGDVAVARRILGIGARELPLEAELPSAPPAHRWRYRHYAGIRPVLFANAFEGIAWAVLGQQITVGLAIHQFRRAPPTRQGAPRTPRGTVASAVTLGPLGQNCTTAPMGCSVPA
jgi:hypothetical protein